MSRLSFGLCAASLLGLGVMLVLHLRALSGVVHPECEGAVRWSSFVILGGAILLLPREVRERFWGETLRVTPAWALTVVALFWLYGMAAVLRLDFGMCEAGKTNEQVAFTGKWLMVWALAANFYYVAGRCRRENE